MPIPNPHTIDGCMVLVREWMTHVVQVRTKLREMMPHMWAIIMADGTLSLFEPPTNLIGANDTWDDFPREAVYDIVAASLIIMSEKYGENGPPVAAVQFAEAWSVVGTSDKINGMAAWTASGRSLSEHPDACSILMATTFHPDGIRFLHAQCDKTGWSCGEVEEIAPDPGSGGMAMIVGKVLRDIHQVPESDLH